MSHLPASSIDFIPYILSALDNLSGGVVGKAVPITSVDEAVLKNGKFTYEMFGKQETTGQSMLDVYLQGARAFLKTTTYFKCVSFSEAGMALTEEGLKEAAYLR